MRDFIQKNMTLNMINILTINKNINGEFRFLYDESEKFKSTYIKEVKSLLIFKNGEIEFKEILVQFLDGNLAFSGILKNNAEYERLNFNLILNLLSKKNFLKKFDIFVRKEDDSDKKLNIEGSVNLFSNKINFNEISMDNERFLNKKELDFYKSSLESAVTKESIINILNYSKMKEFIKIIYSN